MGPRFASGVLDTAHKYTAPPSHIDFNRVKVRKPSAPRPTKKIVPEVQLAAEAPITILKPFFLVGDLHVDAFVPAKQATIKPKTAKAKALRFLTDPFMKKSSAKPVFNRPAIPLLKLASTPTTPKAAPRMPSKVRPVDLVAGARRRHAEEVWAKAPKHSNAQDIINFFTTTASKAGGSHTLSSSSSSADSTSAGYSPLTSSGTPSGILSSEEPSSPSPSPRSSSAARSLYPFSCAPSPDTPSPLLTPSPVFPSVIMEEQRNLDINGTMPENVFDSEAADVTEEVVDQNEIKTEDVDIVANVAAEERKRSLMEEETSTLANLSRATETINDLLALVQRQAQALKIQEAEIHDQQQLLSTLGDRMRALEALPISQAKTLSATPTPKIYDTKAISKVIMDEVATNAICTPAAGYLDKNALKNLIKEAAMELQPFAPAPSAPPPPPPPPPLARASQLPRADTKTAVPKKSFLSRGPQRDPKFVEELTATIKSLNATSGSSIRGSRASSPSDSNVSSSSGLSSPHCLTRNRIPLRNRAGSPSDSDRSSASSFCLSSAASPPPWNCSSLRPSHSPTLVSADAPRDLARKLAPKNCSTAQVPSPSVPKQTNIKWGRRVNATIPVLSRSPHDKRLAAELASVKARKLVAGKLT